jgi:hypothetical protein
VSEQPTTAPGVESVNKSRLFLLSVIALATTGMMFSIRGGVAAELQRTFFDPIDPVNAAALVTKVIGFEFLGFAVSVLFGSPLCDTLGMGRLLQLSALLFLGGTVATVLAPVTMSAQMVLSLSMLSVGLARGLVEAVINPLIATIYADDKTHRLNVLHAWWPGGIIIGGLIAATPLGWKLKMGLALIPTLVFLIMSVQSKFPPTERVQAKISTQETVRTVLNPLFILLMCCMMLTASSELAPGQWVDSALTRTVHMRGIWLLIYVSGLMFVMRHFAGSFAHRLSPIGLLFCSCAMASLGLFALSHANSPFTGLLSATLWGIGVCYMWPTMLGVTSERFARGGALALGMMGSVGNLAIFLVLPMIGAHFDKVKVAAAGGPALFKALEEGAKHAPAIKAQLDVVLVQASGASFVYVAKLPAVLIFVFGIWWLKLKASGGYKAENLLAQES